MPTALDQARVSYLDDSYARSPLLWLSQQVRTHDEHDSENPVKPFPIHKPYLQHIANAWRDASVLLVEKSRQMMVSWLMIALHLHLALWVPHRRVFLQSKREDDACAMLDRCWHMYERLDPWLRERHKATRTATKIFLANGSEIWAIPHGAQVLRQYTSSAIFSDELGFQEDAEESFGASLPTVTGGGKYTGVSSANPGFFQGAIAGAKENAATHESLMTGMDLWAGAPGNISALRVHYSCDPDAKVQAKVEQARAAYTATGRQAWFKKEYEIDYGALSGQLIYPNLRADLHQIPRFEIPADWKRYRSIDPGWRNPCAVIWAALAPKGWRGCDVQALVVYREFYQRQWNVTEIAKAINRLSAGEGYQVTLIDPSSAIHKGNEAMGRSTYEQFVAEGISLVAANNTVDAGLEDVRRRFSVYGNSPALLIFNDLPNIWRELTSYRYRELSARQLETAEPPEAPVKRDDHASDALRYLCAHAPLRLAPAIVQAAAPRGTFAYLVQREKKLTYARGLLGNLNFTR